MITIKVKIDYPVKPNKDGTKPAVVLKPQERTLDFFAFAVGQKYKEGLESQFRRVWARIEGKFDKAIDEDLETIDLEDGEKDFLKGAFRDCKFPYSYARFTTILEDEMDNWGKKPAEEATAPKTATAPKKKTT